jgi:4-amino-4-deoxy-L-arabinose transferase-like glycosyltransferase
MTTQTDSVSEFAILEPAARSQPGSSTPSSPSRSTAIFVLAALWAIVFFASLFAPPLLDDADATHSNAARHILSSGDWVTLYVNGIRYLEKAPLPYWLDAISFKLFGFNAFAAHLPQATAVFLLALLGYIWASKAYSARAGLYAGIAVLTSAGVFLFTRIFIPEIWLSLFLATALYCFLQSLSAPPVEDVIATGAKQSGEPPAFVVRPTSNLYPYGLWVSLALAVLTKGLVAPVFIIGTAIIYLALTGEYRQWHRLKPFTGILLFLAIAAPWHILAGLRNTDGALNGHPHGFFWFYFVNEHFLRFLGKRYPVDYNKLPGYLFWSLHLVWLFPWALFTPLLLTGVRRRVSAILAPTYAARTTLLLTLYSALVLLFFSFSTNQEYYTFPAYLPLLMLLAAALTRAESTYTSDRSSRRRVVFAHAALTVIGAAVSIALFIGLWRSRHLPFVPDIGELLAHRGVGDYTLSMSHLFDLTDSSFAALRLPATIAAMAFAFGPALAWFLRSQRRHLAATSAIAVTSATFLVAAHIALIRFGPMLSSQPLAARIADLRSTHAIAPDTRVMLYGDQSYGSSIAFYLGEQLPLVEGRSSSMIFGSSFPDAPHIFLTNADLIGGWGTGPRKLIFVPLERRDALDRVLPVSLQIVLAETSGKALITDRPLDETSSFVIR